LSAVARKDEKLRAIVERVHRRALEAAEGLFLEPGEPGYNEDADRPWAEASTRTRAGILLAQKAIDSVRDDKAAARQFGLLILKERIGNPEKWEEFAQNVDAQQIAAAHAALPSPDDEDEPEPGEAP